MAGKGQGMAGKGQGMAGKGMEGKGRAGKRISLHVIQRYQEFKASNREGACVHQLLQALLHCMVAWDAGYGLHEATMLADAFACLPVFTQCRVMPPMCDP